MSMALQILGVIRRHCWYESILGGTLNQTVLKLGLGGQLEGGSENRLVWSPCEVR